VACRYLSAATGRHFVPARGFKGERLKTIEVSLDDFTLAQLDDVFPAR